MTDAAQHITRWRHHRACLAEQPTDGGNACAPGAVPISGAPAGAERDPIKTLMRSRLGDIVTAASTSPRCPTRQSQDFAGGAAHAAAAAQQGLFPRSRVSSPWQLLLEHGMARDCREAVLGGGAYHMRGALCAASDLRLFDALRGELGRGVGAWSRGSTGKAKRKWSLPGINGQGLPIEGSCLQDLQGNDLPITTSILRRLCTSFAAECLVWWVNVYEDGSADRSFHHDCSAGDRGRNITIGGSFGAMRDLTFRHSEDRSRSFNFSQWNGDVFAFRESVNSTFEHGILPYRSGQAADVGPRISVIIMGRTPDSIDRKSVV